VSCWVGEWGTILLPPNAITVIVQAIISRNNQIATDGLALAQRAWDECTAEEQSSRDAVRMKVQQLGAIREDDDWQDTNESYRAQHILDVFFFNAGPPRAPHEQHAQFLSSDTVEFHDISAADASLSFDTEAGTMTWHVDDERYGKFLRAGWLAEAVFSEISKIAWTPGTGGWFTGNDDYNCEEGGDEYVTRAYGPLGMEEYPDNTEPFTMGG